MNQIKIGKFIKEKRKEQKITQDELAEKLGVTNRAISKWENGNCMPDSSIIHDLCKILNITINDLFNGEIVDKKDNDKKLEKYLLEVYRQKEIGDRKLLNFEVVFGTISMIFSIFIISIVAYLEESNFIDEKYIFLIVVPTLIYMVIMCIVLLKIEQIAGYYECNDCKHKYVPKFSSVFLAMHIGRTRYMKCPKCSKWSWNKKIVGSEEND
jgi:transcriptional regulator with XRE-family HTH domain